MANKVFRAALLIILLYALKTSFALRMNSPVEPFYSGDSWGYISPAMKALAGDGFDVTHGRNYPYPLFLYLVLATLGSTAAIVTVQHALGLLGLIALAGAWLELRRLIERTELGSGFSSWLLGLVQLASAGLLLWVVGTSSTVLRYEQFVGPEALFVPGTALLVYLLFRVYRKVAESRRLGVDLYLLLVFNFFLYLIRPLYFLGSLLSGLIPLAAAKRVYGWRRLIAVFLLSVATFLLLGILPDRALRVNDKWRETFGPMVLFAFNAPFTAAVLQQDLADNPNQPKAECMGRILDRLVLSFSAAKKHPAAVHFGEWGVTNIYGDFFIYGNSFSGVEIKGDTGERGVAAAVNCFERPEDLARFYWKYSIMAVATYPTSYLKKTLIDLGFYYRQDVHRLRVHNYTHESIVERSQDKLRKFRASILERSQIGQQMLKQGEQEAAKFNSLPYLKRTLEQRIDWWFLPLTAVAFAFFCFEFAVRTIRRRWAAGWWAVPLSWISVHLVIFFTNLCVSLTHTLFIARYIDGVFVLTATAAAINIVGISASVASIILNRKPVRI